MKAIPRIALTLLLFAFTLTRAFAQGTSSKGTEFWTCFMDHISAAGPSGSQMVLYITSDTPTSGTVSFTDGTVAIPYTITANTVTFVPIPASQFLNTEGQFKKGIHITALKPVAVYAHIYASSVSGATLLIPVNTMGKDYISLNYKQLSNTGPAYSTFAVIATEDNTTIEITPTATLLSGKSAGQAFTITLNKGEVYQGLSATDLTGTRIKSTSTTTGTCKKIAVFSGSSKIGIGCQTSTNTNAQSGFSSDNLFQQVYPTATWGKNFITVSLKSRNYDIYRIVLSKPVTAVTLNGTVIPAASFTNGLFYEFSTSGVKTNVISADQPIQVVQYTPTQGQQLNVCPVPTPANELYGDPEMIFLTPIEQGLDHVTLYSTGYHDIANAFINVVIPTSAASSFTIDGISGTVFTPIVGTNYSYAQISTTHGPNSPGANYNFGGTLTSGTHNIRASQPFNAIAYGFGSAESYGYAAGTNLIDLNKFIALQNADGSTSTGGTTVGCVNTSYKLEMTLPYPTTNIQWDLKDGNPPVVDAAPVAKSTTVKGTTTLYTYEYAGTVKYTKGGDYTVVATVFNPFGDDCGSNEDIEFNFSVAELPTADFTKTDNCLGVESVFTDKTDAKNSTIKSYLWDFGDGTAKATTQNAKHTYTKATDYPVTLTVINDNGCSNSSAVQMVHISALPQAAFDISTVNCATQAITFTDKSAPIESSITKWVWDFGDGTAPTPKTDNTPFPYTFAAAGIYTVSLTVTTAAGCTATTQQKVTVNPTPKVAFTLPGVCLANSAAQFTDTTPAIAGKTFQYQWNFGDDINATTNNPNTSLAANPTHIFIAGGTYHVSLTITTPDNCAVTVVNDYIVTGKAKFSAPAQACPNDMVTFTDQTDPSNTTVTAWNWDFGGDGTANIQNPQHVFKNPGDYPVTLTVSGNNGCSVTAYTQNIHIPVNPTAAFNFTSPDCETQAITFIDASKQGEHPITHWMWDFGDGSAVEDYPNNQSVNHKFTNYGIYTVKLTLTTSAGCISTTYQQDVIVRPMPKPDFTMPDACLKDFAQFFDKSNIDDGTESDFKYEWNFGDPNANAANPNISTDKNPMHRFTEARNDANPYKITLSVTSKYGCKIALPPRDFTVNGEFPTAGLMPLPTNTYCSSDDVQMKNNANVSFGKITKVFVYWDWDRDQTNPSVYLGDAALNGSVYLHNYGIVNIPGYKKDYKIRMIAYTGSSASCTSPPFDYPITIKSNPLINVTAPDPLCQEHSPATIQTNTNGFTGTGTFSGTGITDKNKGIFDPAVSGPGTFTLTYTFTADNSCGYSTTILVTVYPTPTVSAGTDQTVLEGGSLTLNPTAGPQPLTYKWAMADGSKAIGLDRDDVANPTASPTDNSVYMLTVTSATGCSASSTVKVTVLKAPIVPNTFTPNGDGYNDKWEIKYLDTYPNATVEIFNRLGTKLYSSNGYAIPWDGTYQGAELPVGTYYYIINPKNGRKIISGSVTIIR